DLGLEHESFIKTACSRGKNLPEDVQGIRVLVTERHRVPDNVHLRICLSLTIQALLSYLFRFEGDHVGRRRAALWNTPKIFLRESRGIAGLKVSDKNHRDVLRCVIERKEFVRLRFANGRN